MSTASHEVILETLTYGGEALGRLEDGRPVFVPFGLPGERVEIRLTSEKRGYARGEILRVLEPSPQRIKARCRHFGQCGGCHYQHMPYGSQLKAKADILRDQLVRIGSIENPPVLEMQASPQPWNYRNHVQFHLTEDGKLGFIRAGRSLEDEDAAVIPVTECHLPEPAINDLWPRLEFEGQEGIERVSVRAGNEDQLMLVLEADVPEPPPIDIEAQISVVHVYQGNTLVMAGDDSLEISIRSETPTPREKIFRVSAPAFFQVNTPMAEKMISEIRASLPLAGAVVLDVYCGVGLFSAFLAPEVSRLIGIEESPSACEDFSNNLDEFNNVELYEGRAELILPHLDLNPDIILVDPPRAGVERHALDAIVKLAPRHIAYVSCDPATLARDASRLIKGGYRLIRVKPFDLFPQTYHIESISLFER